MISYLFPPIGGGGVLRMTKFAKYLPSFGWETFVLTVKKGFYPIEDRSLLDELPKKIKINRIGYLEPGFWFKASRWRSLLAYFLYPFFFLPDNQILWFLPALIRGYKLIKKEKIKIIITSASSYSDHLIALVLKKITKVKWVADFRDEWTKSPYIHFPTFFHRISARFLEKQFLKNADLVLTVSEGLETSYQHILGNKDDKFEVVTNGYDAADFSNLKAKYKRNEIFTIVHTGSLYSSRRADLFLEALADLNLKKVKVEFIGEKIRLPHCQVLGRLIQADVLLLVLSPQDGPAVLTGKIFEYLAARRPILAVAPPNSGAAQLVKKLNVGEVADPLDKNEISQKILKLYHLWQKKRLAIPQIDLEPFERKNLTGRLSDLLEELTEQRRIKLCLIGNILSPQNQNLVEFFKKKSYEIHFISSTPGTIGGIKSYWLGKKSFTPWYFLRSLLAVRRLCREISPDIIHGQDLVFAGIWAYLSGVRPLVVTPWGSDVMNYNQFIGSERYLIKKTLEAADLVTISSQALKDKVCQIATPRAIETVHFGVDLKLFQAKKIESQNPRVIYCPRSIAPIYNTDVLIEAFARIAKKNLKLVLTTQNTDEPYLIEVEKKVIKYNLLDQVQFLPSLKFDQIPRLYNLAEVVVTLTSSDGCSVSFLESMASAKKIVATNLPYIKEWFTGDNLWLVGIRDIEATSKALLAALKFPSKRWQPIGQRNRELVAQRAEIKTNFEKLNELYQSLLINM